MLFVEVNLVSIAEVDKLDSKIADCVKFKKLLKLIEILDAFVVRFAVVVLLDEESKNDGDVEDVSSKLVNISVKFD